MIEEIGGIISQVIGPFSKIIDEVHTSSEEKLKLKNELFKLQQKLPQEIIKAKRDIIVAELKQDDKYTKRARPTVIYGGLMILFINYVLLPWIAYFTHNTVELPKIVLPDAFWIAWGGVTGVYAFGRTKEKISRG